MKATEQTIKEKILKYFRTRRMANVKIAAEKLGLTAKQLMAHLWCMERREDRLWYFAAEGNVEVIVY